MIPTATAINGWRQARKGKLEPLPHGIHSLLPLPNGRPLSVNAHGHGAAPLGPTATGAHATPPGHSQPSWARRGERQKIPQLFRGRALLDGRYEQEDTNEQEDKTTKEGHTTQAESRCTCREARAIAASWHSFSTATAQWAMSLGSG